MVAGKIKKKKKKRTVLYGRVGEVVHREELVRVVLIGNLMVPHGAVLAAAGQREQGSARWSAHSRAAASQRSTDALTH
jgi:hypothetical protein